MGDRPGRHKAFEFQKEKVEKTHEKEWKKDISYQIKNAIQM